MRSFLRLLLLFEEYTSERGAKRYMCKQMAKNKRKILSYRKIKHIGVQNSKKSSKTFLVTLEKGPLQQFDPNRTPYVFFFD